MLLRFSVKFILGGVEVQKSAILTHLEALNFDFNEFLHFLKSEIYQMNKVQNKKNGSFRS